MIIAMTQSDDGAWLYTDPAQTELVFDLEAVSGRDLTMYDVLLNDSVQWSGNEKAREWLASLRHELTHTYKQYFHDNAMLEMACNHYWRALQGVRMNITGRSLELEDVRRKTQPKTASKAPRPNAKSPLKAAIITAMHRHKSDCDNFKSFMAMWALGHLDGLTSTEIENAEKYAIADENGDMGETIYTLGSLRSMYSKA